jgi:hypothetical protein
VANQSVINLYSSVVHTTASFAIADITGTVGASASFDASIFGNNSSYSYQWSWQTVPAGSSFTNQILPLPDGGVNTFFNMTDNQGLWHFEGGADDDSGNGRNGTISNASLVAGKVGSNAYQFVNTDNSYIDFGQASDFLSPRSPFSIAIWIKGDGGWTPSIFDAVVGFSNGFSWSEGVGIFWNNATTIRGFADAYNGQTVDATITNVDEWNHIAMTYDQADLRIYVNGVLSDTTNVGTNLTGLGNNLQVGRLGTHGRLEASLDEFAIWERTLTSAEVGDIFFIQSGSMATDASGNVGLGSTFTFVPDVTGTYTTDFTLAGPSSGSTSADAVISAAGPTPPTPGPIITGSSPTVNLVESKNLGYVFNTYRIQNLSVQRSRTSEQVPFRLGTKGKQSLRLRTNTEFTGSS